jgi:hypothetical protein
MSVGGYGDSPAERGHGQHPRAQGRGPTIVKFRPVTAAIRAASCETATPAAAGSGTPDRSIVRLARAVTFTA